MSGDSAAIRARLGHPVIDADGHLIETIPVFHSFFVDFVKDLGGGDLARRFEAAGGIDFDDMVLRPWSALSARERRAAWTTRPTILIPGKAFRAAFSSSPRKAAARLL